MADASDITANIAAGDGSDKKTLLLTGGNSGIGLEACKIMCSEGHRVIATVRTAEKGEHCISEVKAYYNKADIHYMICDISVPDSVRNLAKNFRQEWLGEDQYLDVLVNNAGVTPPSDGRTAPEGHPDWELAMATNCLGAVLLADLLTVELKRTADIKGESRLIFVGSAIIKFDNLIKPVLDVDNIMKVVEPFPGNINCYKNSKVALMFCIQALKAELEKKNIIIVAVCPGMVPNTNINKYDTAMTRFISRCCLGCCCYICVRPVSNHQGGEFVVEMAVRERGAESHGLFYSRGMQLSIPPQFLSKESQSKVMNQVRKFTEL